MSITITKELQFDAGHRVLGHEGKCRHLHGHRYVAEIEVMADSLNNLGMVIDFSVIKTRVGGWIDECWDHNLLLHSDDPLWKVDLVDTDLYRQITNGKRPYEMPNGNPTAENMAMELFRIAQGELYKSSIKVLTVTIWETPSCKAVYRNQSIEHLLS